MKRSLNAAVIGICAVVAIVIGVLHIDSLPLIGNPDTSYSAAFSDAGGLQIGDPVELSGMKVGTVENLAIGQQDVIVTFRIRSNIRLGADTRAAVKVSSLLGAKYLDVQPAGLGHLPGGGQIPLARTTPAYDIVAAFSQLTDTTAQIDKPMVAKALDTLAATFQNSPSAVRGAVRGIAKLSATVAQRDAEFSQLLSHARVTTGLLAARRTDLLTLMRSATAFLSELDARRAAVQRLLISTSTLFDQLKHLVTDNQATLRPALIEVQGVLDTLTARKTELRSLLKNMDIFARVFTNTVGSGPWFDAVIPNLPTHASVGGPR